MDDTNAKGNFFAVDRRCVEDATRYGDGITTAIAYLALARFTRHDQRNTLAGATAVCTRAGLTRGRTDLALKTLERAGLISRPGKGSLCVLRPWAEVLAARANLNPRQAAVWNRYITMTNPITAGTDPDYQVAYGLVKKDLLELTEAEEGKSRFKIASPDWVWLPNTLVDGFPNVPSPLTRLRQIQDKRAVPLLMDCYHSSNLAEYGGLPWQGIRKNYIREKTHKGDQFTRYGHFTLYRFLPESKSFTWDAFPPAKRFRTYECDADGRDSGADDFWEVWGALEKAGLIEFVGHIVEGLGPEAQVLHPYATSGTGEPVERSLAYAAHHAAFRCIVGQPDPYNMNVSSGLTDSPFLCPVPAHITHATLVGIARPVHRPHTKMTAAWAATFLHQCQTYQKLFEALGNETEIAVA